MEDEPGKYHVYKRRWYILCLFSLFAFLQCFIWNTFGPLTYAVEFAYKWGDETIAMMPNWGAIMFLVALAPLTWIVERKGKICDMDHGYDIQL